jgi:hypothetical protein
VSAQLEGSGAVDPRFHKGGFERDGAVDLLALQDDAYGNFCNLLDRPAHRRQAQQDQRRKRDIVEAHSRQIFSYADARIPRDA